MSLAHLVVKLTHYSPKVGKPKTNFHQSYILFQLFNLGKELLVQLNLIIDFKIPITFVPYEYI